MIDATRRWLVGSTRLLDVQPRRVPERVDDLVTVSRRVAADEHARTSISFVSMTSWSLPNGLERAETQINV
eukprot:253852-Prymnesium_polylepis.1